MRIAILCCLLLAAASGQAHELYEAIVDDRVEAVEAYLAEGGDPNAFLEVVLEPDPPRAPGPRSVQLLPLDIALFAGRDGDRPASDAIAVLLMRGGADPALVEAHSPIPTPVLARAAAGGMRRTVEHLLQVDPGALLPEDETPPLISASARGHLEVVRTMLDAARDHGLDWGNTLNRAFVASALNEHDETAAALLEAGVDPDGEGVLSLAVHYLSIDLVRELLARGADPTRRWGPSRPLDHAVHRLYRLPGPESEEVLIELVTVTPDVCEPLPDSRLTQEISDAALARLGELVPQCNWYALVP